MVADGEGPGHYEDEAGENIAQALLGRDTEHNTGEPGTHEYPLYRNGHDREDREGHEKVADHRREHPQRARRRRHRTADKQVPDGDGQPGRGQDPGHQQDGGTDPGDKARMEAGGVHIAVRGTGDQGGQGDEPGQGPDHPIAQATVSLQPHLAPTWHHCLHWYSGTRTLADAASHRRTYCECMATLAKTGQVGSRLSLSWRFGAAPRRSALMGLCVGLNVLETCLVGAFGHGSHPDLAPQASAVAPFGVFGDLRWVSVYHDSWPALAAELVGTLVVRGFVTALSIGLSWPTNLPQPRPGALLRRGVLATALAAVLLLPSVTLLFGMAAIPVSWLFLAAVPTALLVAMLVHPAAVSPDWWRRVVSARAVGWVVCAFIVLTLSSAVMAGLPEAFWPLVAVLSGLFNAWSWTALVHAVVDRRPARHTVPVAALTAVVVAGTIVGGAVLGFSAARNAQPKRVTAAAHPAGNASPVVKGTSPERPKGPALLIVSGYGSTWDGQPDHQIPGNYIEERFSYRGLGVGGSPLPYTSTDTAKPLATLDRMLLAQVSALHSRTGLTVAVVSESEGALVAKTALLAEPDRAVSVLIMASPLESPGRVSYPTRGDGWGVASNAAMRLISDAFQGISPVDLSPDSALLSSLDHDAPLLENAMSCPISGVHQFALLPLADATVSPAAEKLPFPSVVLAAFHGGLLETASGEKVVADVLRDRPVTDDQLLALADAAIAYAATAWQVPSLTASDYPNTVTTGAANGPGCGTVARELRAGIYRRS